MNKKIRAHAISSLESCFGFEDKKNGSKSKSKRKNHRNENGDDPEINRHRKHRKRERHSVENDFADGYKRDISNDALQQNNRKKYEKRSSSSRARAFRDSSVKHRYHKNKREKDDKEVRELMKYQNNILESDSKENLVMIPQKKKTDQPLKNCLHSIQRVMDRKIFDGFLNSDLKKNKNYASGESSANIELEHRSRQRKKRSKHSKLTLDLRNETKHTDNLKIFNMLQKDDQQPAFDEKNEEILKQKIRKEENKIRRRRRCSADLGHLDFESNRKEKHRRHSKEEGSFEKKMNKLMHEYHIREKSSEIDKIPVRDTQQPRKRSKSKQIEAQFYRKVPSIVKPTTYQKSEEIEIMTQFFNVDSQISNSNHFIVEGVQPIKRPKHRKRKPKLECKTVSIMAIPSTFVPKVGLGHVFSPAETDLIEKRMKTERFKQYYKYSDAEHWFDRSLDGYSEKNCDSNHMHADADFINVENILNPRTLTFPSYDEALPKGPWQHCNEIKYSDFSRSPINFVNSQKIVEETHKLHDGVVFLKNAAFSDISDSSFDQGSVSPFPKHESVFKLNDSCEPLIKINENNINTTSEIELGGITIEEVEIIQQNNDNENVKENLSKLDIRYISNEIVNKAMAKQNFAKKKSNENVNKNLTNTEEKSIEEAKYISNTKNSEKNNCGKIKETGPKPLLSKIDAKIFSKVEEEVSNKVLETVIKKKDPLKKGTPRSKSSLPKSPRPIQKLTKSKTDINMEIKTQENLKPKIKRSLIPKPISRKNTDIKVKPKNDKRAQETKKDRRPLETKNIKNAQDTKNDKKVPENKNEKRLRDFIVKGTKMSITKPKRKPIIMDKSKSEINLRITNKNDFLKNSNSLVDLDKISLKKAPNLKPSTCKNSVAASLDKYINQSPSRISSLFLTKDYRSRTSSFQKRKIYDETLRKKMFRKKSNIVPQQVFEVRFLTVFDKNENKQMIVNNLVPVSENILQEKSIAKPEMLPNFLICCQNMMNVEPKPPRCKKITFKTHGTSTSKISINKKPSTRNQLISVCHLPCYNCSCSCTSSNETSIISELLRHLSNGVKEKNSQKEKACETENNNYIELICKEILSKKQKKKIKKSCGFYIRSNGTTSEEKSTTTLVRPNELNAMSSSVTNSDFKYLEYCTEIKNTSEFEGLDLKNKRPVRLYEKLSLPVLKSAPSSFEFLYESASSSDCYEQIRYDINTCVLLPNDEKFVFKKAKKSIDSSSTPYSEESGYSSNKNYGSLTDFFKRRNIASLFKPSFSRHKMIKLKKADKNEKFEVESPRNSETGYEDPEIINLKLKEMKTLNDSSKNLHKVISYYPMKNKQITNKKKYNIRKYYKSNLKPIESKDCESLSIGVLKTRNKNENKNISKCHTDLKTIESETAGNVVVKSLQLGNENNTEKINTCSMEVKEANIENIPFESLNININEKEKETSVKEANIEKIPFESLNKNINEKEKETSVLVFDEEKNESKLQFPQNYNVLNDTTFPNFQKMPRVTSDISCYQVNKNHEIIMYDNVENVIEGDKNNDVQENEFQHSEPISKCTVISENYFLHTDSETQNSAQIELLHVCTSQDTFVSENLSIKEKESEKCYEEISETHESPNQIPENISETSENIEINKTHGKENEHSLKQPLFKVSSNSLDLKIASLKQKEKFKTLKHIKKNIKYILEQYFPNKKQYFSNNKQYVSNEKQYSSRKTLFKAEVKADPKINESDLKDINNMEVDINAKESKINNLSQKPSSIYMDTEENKICNRFFDLAYYLFEKELFYLENLYQDEDFFTEKLYPLVQKHEEKPNVLARFFGSKKCKIEKDKKVLVEFDKDKILYNFIKLLDIDLAYYGAFMSGFIDEEESSNEHFNIEHAILKRLAFYAKRRFSSLAQAVVVNVSGEYELKYIRFLKMLENFENGDLSLIMINDENYELHVKKEVISNFENIIEFSKFILKKKAITNDQIQLCRMFTIKYLSLVKEFVHIIVTYIIRQIVCTEPQLKDVVKYLLKLEKNQPLNLRDLEKRCVLLKSIVK